MRKVTEQTVRAFFNGEKKSIGNTVVTVVDGETALSLHGNIIALRDSKGVVQINNKGYTTNTTKERLNGILSYLNNDYIKQIKGEWFIVSDGEKTEFPYAEWVTL